MSNQKGLDWILIVMLIITSLLFISTQEMKNLRDAVEFLSKENKIVNQNCEELRREKILLERQYEELQMSYDKLKEEKEEQKSDTLPSRNPINRRAENEQVKDLGIFTITAYDNSVQSQGKWVNQTATGFNLKGHTLETAKCIAVDPKIIPLKSKVKLTFKAPYTHLNGIYIAYDTGGAIKGRRIDLFFGDGSVRQEALNFGKRKVEVQLLK